VRARPPKLRLPDSFESRTRERDAFAQHASTEAVRERLEAKDVDRTLDPYLEAVPKRSDGVGSQSLDDDIDVGPVAEAVSCQRADQPGPRDQAVALRSAQLFRHDRAKCSRPRVEYLSTGASSGHEGRGKVLRSNGHV
jgi:hypothetical protein